jgi:hypothetical protein
MSRVFIRTLLEKLKLGLFQTSYFEALIGTL